MKEKYKADGKVITRYEIDMKTNEYVKFLNLLSLFLYFLLES